MYLDFHAKCPNLIFNKSGPSQHIYMKIPNIKFHRNPSSWSHTETWRQTNRHKAGWTDIMKLKGTFCDYANAPSDARNFVSPTST